MSQNHIHPTFYLGIDVSKDFLDLDPDKIPSLQKLDNSSTGFAKLIRALQRLQKKGALPHVVLEATGGYERPLVLALHRHQLCVSVLPPKRVKDFASAIGRPCKTDAIDAAVITRFAEAVRPEPSAPPSAVLVELADLVKRRNDLVASRVQELNRQKQYASASSLESIEKLLCFLDGQIEHLGQKLKDLVLSDPMLCAKFNVLTQIEGVGPLTAFGVLASMPELGRVSRQQIASLAGLAPKNHDSGQFTGRRFIKGGRCEARKALYMAAVCARRFNPVLSPLYQHLVNAGKPPKLAITALMRRLLTHMNSKLREFLNSHSSHPPISSPQPA